MMGFNSGGVKYQLSPPAHSGFLGRGGDFPGRVGIFLSRCGIFLGWVSSDLLECQLVPLVVATMYIVSIIFGGVSGMVHISSWNDLLLPLVPWALTRLPAPTRENIEGTCHIANVYLKEFTMFCKYKLGYGMLGTI